MVKRWAIMLLLLLVCASAWSQQKRVAVFIEGPADENTDAGRLMQSTETLLSYYLDISNQYTVIEFDNIPDGVASGTLAAAAENYNLDQVVYAEFPEGNAGSVAFRVYDAASNVEIYSETLSADPAKESTGAAQELLDPLVNTLFDPQTSWGALVLSPRGADGSYSVSVDGIPAGRNIADALWVPEGEHVVEARQTRPFGAQILLEEQAEVSRGSRNRLSFAIPELTDLERTAFDEIDQRILDAWDGDADFVKEQLDFVTGLFDGETASETLGLYRDKYLTWNEDFRANRKATEIAIEPPAAETVSDEIAARIEGDLVADSEANTGNPAIDDGQAVILAEPKARSGFGTILLAASAPLLERLGGVARTLAQESMYRDEVGRQVFPSYSNLSYNVDTANEIFYWSSLGLYGGAALTGSFLFPARSYTLSPWGKFLYASGVLFDAAGNTLSLASHYLRAVTARVEYEYTNAQWDVWQLGEQLDKAYNAYAFTRIGSYAAWSLGTAATVTAPLVGGRRSTAVSGPFQKLLHFAGPLFTALGNLSSIVSYNSRLLVDERTEEYYSADFSTGYDYYGDYETAYAFYFWSTIGSYGFWGLGALSSILSVVLPEKPASSIDATPGDTRPQPLFTVEPRDGGVYAGVRMAI